MMVDRATVFCLHRLACVEHGVRGHEIQFIADALTQLRQSGATFVSLCDIVNANRAGGQADGNWVAFTIDDGFADQYQIARSVFVEQGVPVTIFPVSGFLDGILWPWDDQLAYAFRHAPCQQVELQLGERSIHFELSDPAKRRRAMQEVREWCKLLEGNDLYAAVREFAARLGTLVPECAPPGYEPMTWAQARELEGLGVDFGVHTVTHRVISRLDDQQAEWELRECWNRLSAELKNPLPVVAWPTGRSGDYSLRDERLAQKLGLSLGVSTTGDYTLLKGARESGGFTASRFALPTSIGRVLQYGSWIERGKQLVRSGLRLNGGTPVV
jgi:peptidoglycan/xylan/chitin deacetylase (PgdA/CDA1 family)